MDKKRYRTKQQDKKQIYFMNFAIRIMLSQHLKSSTVPYIKEELFEAKYHRKL